MICHMFLSNVLKKTHFFFGSKFYKEHVAKYLNIRDDYMKKYKAFPLAVTLQENMAKLEEDKAKVKNTDVEADLKAKIESIEGFPL